MITKINQHSHEWFSDDYELQMYYICTLKVFLF